MLKVFISYSHADELFKDALVEHLAPLIRSNSIEIWHDRQIPPGKEWNDEISDKLEAAEIIFFLVSSAFINSDYCYGVEVNRALELHNENLAKVMPIIIRPCDWHSLPFGTIQCMPKDADPISTWSNSDSAWLDVIKKVRLELPNIPKKTSSHQVPAINADDTKSNVFSESHALWLNDTEMVFSHRTVNRVNLQDVYVYPDVVDQDDAEKTVFKSSRFLVSSKGYYLLLGDEQGGKTSLLKKVMADIDKNLYLSVYINGKDVKTSDINNLINKSIQDQYSSPQFDESNLVIIIDDVDKIKLNNKHTNVLLNNLIDSYNFVILTANQSYAFMSNEIAAIDRYSSLKILPFGHVKREEMVNKWVALGREQVIDDESLYHDSDTLIEKLNSVIKNNIVPSKPIYVLLLLQMFEAYSQQNFELTSYGHCYQQLIYQSLEGSGIVSTDHDKYLNVLTEISWKMFLQGGKLSSNTCVSDFFREYKEQYILKDGDELEIIKKLKMSAILSGSDNSISFKYPYIYYFFVGKYIAEKYKSDSVVSQKFDLLTENIQREDYANVLIFITHHTKDNWVLSKLKSVLQKLFQEQKKATLNKMQLDFMRSFIDSIPKLVMEQREVQKERELRNNRLDSLERESISDEDLDDSENDFLSNLNRTFKGMDVAGQIIRNRYATITKNELYELADSGISTGLRFLDYFIEITDTAKHEIINLIRSKLEDNPALTDRELLKAAEESYLHLTFGIISAVVRKISYSIGSRDAAEIYKRLEEAESSPAYTLIKQAIELQYTRTVNIDSLKDTISKIESNPVCIHILKEIVIQHTYMFPVKYDTKQKISSLLKISVQSQRLMDQNKRVKE